MSTNVVSTVIFAFKIQLHVTAIVQLMELKQHEKKRNAIVTVGGIQLCHLCILTSSASFELRKHASGNRMFIVL